MKILLAAACFIALFALGGADARACSCALPSSSDIERMSGGEFSRRFLGFDGAMFEGRVVKNALAASAAGGSREVTFEVERYWKGGRAKRVLVRTAAGGASCGVPYEVGRRYLVVAVRLGGELQANLCTHLGANKNRAALLRRLGRGERPKG